MREAHHYLIRTRCSSNRAPAGFYGRGWPALRRRLFISSRHFHYRLLLIAFANAEKRREQTKAVSSLDRLLTRQQSCWPAQSLYARLNLVHPLPLCSVARAEERQSDQIDLQHLAGAPWHVCDKGPRAACSCMMMPRRGRVRSQAVGWEYRGPAPYGPCEYYDPAGWGQWANEAPCQRTAGRSCGAVRCGAVARDRPVLKLHKGGYEGSS